MPSPGPALRSSTASGSSCGWWATTDPGAGDALQLTDHFFRTEYGRVVGSLARWLGAEHLDLAEDAVQEAMAAAVRTWPLRGLPRDPTAWLVRAARNHAVDVLRRTATLDAKLPGLAASTVEADPGASLTLPDDQLELMLLCCHPQLRPAERVALTLKAVAGFGTDEVARAFLVTVPTVAQRIVRAKRRLREVGAELAPASTAAAADRVPSVLDVLYLVFNEGYSFGPDEGLRIDMAEEAVRLVQLLAAHPLGDRPDVHALAALLLLQSSRLQARVDAGGAALALRDQDRSAWDRDRIAAGLSHLEVAGRGDRLTDFHLLAGIAACHAVATGVADTDWDRIAGLYDELVARGRSDVVRLNRAVAVGMAQGPEAGLRLLDELASSPAAPVHLLAAARADCLARMGRRDEARSEWRRAAAAAPSRAERQACEREAARP